MSSWRLMIMAVVGVFSSANANVLFVDDDNCPGAGNGTAGDPYCSIQDAIDAALDSDEIVVAPGTYFETINFLGKAITLRSSDGAELTTIDAQSAGTVVTCESGEGPDTVLEGFTITGGSGGFLIGGGMFNDNNSSPTVSGCTFIDNTAVLIGGGMFNDNNSSPTVTDCTFSGNSAGLGGGMGNCASSPMVIDCTFSGNTSTGWGGGMHNENGSNAIVINCTFSENTADAVGGAGGGMLNFDSDPTVTNCSFIGNVAMRGGGMDNRQQSKPTVTNCTFSDNTVVFKGGGMYNFAGGSATGPRPSSPPAPGSCTPVCRSSDPARCRLSFPSIAV